MADRIEDAGEKIGGARKDWRVKALSIADLEAMTNEEAVELVGRDAVWPEPDWKAIVEAGVSRERAAFFRVFRQKIAKAPVYRRGMTTEEGRRDYVRLIEAIREMTATPSQASIRPYDLASEVRARMAATGFEVGMVCRGRSHICNLTSADHRKIEGLIADGFPDTVPVWQRGVQIVEDEQGFTAFRKRRAIGIPHPTEADAVEALRVAYEAERKRSSTLKKLPNQRPVVDRLERVGPNVREGCDVSPEAFVEILGFRGIEFGNWVPQKERQSLLNAGWDSVHDLADLLGVEPGAVSLGGILAVAFGARGNGGRAAAHYEPGQQVFNFTRMSGAGSLAHEFAHALDHHMGTVGVDGASMTIRGGSGWYHQPRDHVAYLSNLGHDEAGAFAAVMDAIRKSTPAPERFITVMEQKAGDVRNEIAKVESYLARLKAKEAEDGRAPGGAIKYRRQAARWLPTQQQNLASMETLIAQAQKGKVSSAVKWDSEYVKQALKLGNGTSASNYWYRPTELFARAFESWAYDRLKDAGRSSDYLVLGVEEDLYADDEWRGNPYPTGEERVRINEAIDNLVEAIRPRLAGNWQPDEADEKAPSMMAR